MSLSYIFFIYLFFLQGPDCSLLVFIVMPLEINNIHMVSLGEARAKPIKKVLDPRDVVNRQPMLPDCVARESSWCHGFLCYGVSNYGCFMIFFSCTSRIKQIMGLHIGYNIYSPLCGKNSLERRGAVRGWWIGQDADVTTCQQAEECYLLWLGARPERWWGDSRSEADITQTTQRGLCPSPSLLWIILSKKKTIAPEGRMELDWLDAACVSAQRL